MSVIDDIDQNWWLPCTGWYQWVWWTVTILVETPGPSITKYNEPDRNYISRILFGADLMRKLNMYSNVLRVVYNKHDEFMSCKCFTHCWPLMESIQQSLVDFPHKILARWSFYVFLAVSLYKLLNKQSSCLWFDMPWCSCDIMVMQCLRVLFSDYKAVHYFHLKYSLELELFTKKAMWKV